MSIIYKNVKPLMAIANLILLILHAGECDGCSDPNNFSQGEALDEKLTTTAAHRQAKCQQ